MTETVDAEAGVEAERTDGWPRIRVSVKMAKVIEKGFANSGKE